MTVEVLEKFVDFDDKVVFDYNPQPLIVKHILPHVKRYVCFEKPHIYDLLSLTKKAQIVKSFTDIEKEKFDIVIFYDDGIKKEISEYLLFLKKLLGLLAKKGVFVVILVKSRITATFLITFLSQFMKKVSYSKEDSEEVILCQKG